MKKYNAKILLFGEHTVVKGSQALAMPLNSHFGTWQYNKNKKSLQQHLPQFLTYLNNQQLDAVLDTAHFSNNLEKGLYFKSSIPVGYGLGSSGALCAAIYDQYQQISIKNLLELKSLFALMERFFHGTSSGMDPLVCYLNYPLLFSKNGQIRSVQLAEKEHQQTALFLLDTHISRSTAPFVNGFLNRCEDKAYNEKCTTVLVPLVNTAIAALLQNDWEKLYDTTAQISDFQFHFFDFMIPDTFKSVWKKGLESEHFKLKICGAGGGGFLLGVSKDFNTTKRVLRDFELWSILSEI